MQSSLFIPEENRLPTLLPCKLNVFSEIREKMFLGFRKKEVLAKEIRQCRLFSPGYSWPDIEAAVTSEIDHFNSEVSCITPFLNQFGRRESWVFALPNCGLSCLL
jgi:hypothetical protein